MPEEYFAANNDARWCESGLPEHLSRQCIHMGMNARCLCDSELAVEETSADSDQECRTHNLLTMEQKEDVLKKA